MRKRFAIAAGLIVAATTLFLFVALPHKPRSHGRSLPVLLAALDDGEGGMGLEWSKESPKKLTKEHLEALEAIRQMGTNALPELLERLQTRWRPFRSVKERVRDWLASKGFIRQRFIRQELIRPSFSYYFDPQTLQRKLVTKRHWE